MNIAIYGASGYTAGLVLAELLRHDVRPVLVGRDPERLRAAAINAGVVDPDIRVAGLDDPAGLAAAFRDCAVVISCVAPFADRGEPVVRAAIDAGCHYVDITGEQPYVKRIFDTYADDAERAGVTVVPMVNDGGFLADLLASVAAGVLGQPEQVVVAHRLDGGAWSRGSLRTALANLDLWRAGGLIFVDGDWRPGPVDAPRLSVTFPGSSAPSELIGFAFAEVITIPRHVRARSVRAFTDQDVGALLGLTPNQVESMPDGGPGQEARQAGSILLMADIVDADGGRARGVIRGSDPYGTTAVIVVEAARRLARDAAKPGVLAPAQAFEPTAFLDTLAPHGVTWRVET